VVGAARSELDGELDASRLRELVGVQTQDEPGVAARLQVAACLASVECSALEEDVGRLGDLRRFGQHFGEREVEVGVRIVELGRDGMGAEPRRHAAGGAHCAELGELRVAVEPVARLPFPRRRPVGAHPAPVALDSGGEPVLAGRARRADGRDDAAACGVELLVGRAAGAQLELACPIAPEARMRMAVDQARDGRAATPVELDDLFVQRAELGHSADRLDSALRAEHVSLLHDRELAEVGPAQGRPAPRRGDDLREVADEQRRHEGPSPAGRERRVRARARPRARRRSPRPRGAARRCPGR
jgi:hypothetical protein